MQRSIKLTKKAKRIYKIKLKYDVRQISAQDRVDERKNASVLDFSAASYAMWTADCKIMIKQRRPKDDPVQKVRKLIFTWGPWIIEAIFQWEIQIIRAIF